MEKLKRISFLACIGKFFYVFFFSLPFRLLKLILCMTGMSVKNIGLSFGWSQWIWASSFYERRLAEHIFPNPVLQKEAIHRLRPNKAVFSDLSATLYSQEYVTKRFLYCYVTNYYKWISLRQLIWVLCSGCHRSAIKVLTGLLSHL